MFFVVTGSGEAGPVAITCATVASARERAHSLVVTGVLDVLISDPDGLQHAPADFDRLFDASPV